MTASELAERLDARPAGEGWVARCPGHDDCRASLSIGSGDDGRVLLMCHAGCTLENVLAAAHLMMSDLFPAKQTATTTKKRIVATYDYRAVDGTLLYQAVRYEPKDFRQRRPDGRGGWIWKLKDVDRVLYRLPNVMGQRIVIIAEGEKDCDRLHELGYAATTNTGGAGKWKTQFAHILKNSGTAMVGVIADNDEPGRQHADQVVSSCRAVGLVASRIDLPDLPPKGDVSDFLATHSATELETIITSVFAATVDVQPMDDVAGLLGRVDACVRKYVVLSAVQATALALWVAHTHALAAADVTPYINVTSPTKRSGKTRLLEVLEAMVAKPWLTARTSAAALIRKIDGEQPTLLLDETDAAFASDKEYGEALRGVLNAGFKRNGKATVCVGQGAAIQARDFAVFGPKAIAGIGALPDTIADRAIPIILQRKLTSEPIARWRDRDGRAETAPVREALSKWAPAHTAALRDARPELPGELSDRAQDVWESLLAIADLAGGDWPRRARRAAVALMGVVEDTDPRVELLTDVRDILEDTEASIISTKELLEALIGREDRPWATWRRGDKPITARGLARLLGPLGIHPDRHLRTQRGYRTDAFTDAIARYLPIQVSNRHDPNKNGPEPRDGSDFDGSAKNASVTGFSPNSSTAVTHGRLKGPDERESSEEDTNDDYRI